MSGESQQKEAQKDEQNHTDPNWEGFKDYVKKIASVPKEELDERLVEWEQRRRKKRAG